LLCGISLSQITYNSQTSLSNPHWRSYISLENLFGFCASGFPPLFFPTTTVSQHRTHGRLSPFCHVWCDFWKGRRISSLDVDLHFILCYCPTRASLVGSPASSESPDGRRVPNLPLCISACHANLVDMRPQSAFPTLALGGFGVLIDVCCCRFDIFVFNLIVFCEEHFIFFFISSTILCFLIFFSPFYCNVALCLGFQKQRKKKSSSLGSARARSFKK
jgi:hypothetical protein